MENNAFATTIMMVLVSLKIGVAEIVTKPTVTELHVVVGESTFLNCSTDDREEIYWFHTPLCSHQERNIVYGYDQSYLPNIGRFQMENMEANGACNLVIPVVIIGDAGVYDCQVESGLGKKESSELILLDGDPVCEPRMVTHEIIGPNICGIEPNQHILSCTVDYNGNEAILEWRKVRDNRPVNKRVSYGTIDNKRVVYSLTIDGNSNVKNKDSYLCSTTSSATSNDGSKLAQEEEIFKEDCNCKQCEVAIFYICMLVAALVLWCALHFSGVIYMLTSLLQFCLLLPLMPIFVSVILVWLKRKFGRFIITPQVLILRENDDLRRRIQELERAEAEALKYQFRTQLDEIEELKEKETASEIKVIHLEAKVKALEESLYVAESFINDEIKRRVLNVYAKFVTDVDPDRLSDWLVQETVISIDRKQRIRNTNSTTTDRCRALLDHLLSIQHPRAFLVVREALRERKHRLLEHIDNPVVQLQR